MKTFNKCSRCKMMLIPEKKNKFDAFKADLKKVLEKHNASLAVTMEGDTHGIHNEGIIVSFPGEEDRRLTAEYESWLNHSDLEV